MPNGIQLRGEYLYVAEGAKGMRVYDVASIGNRVSPETHHRAVLKPLGQKRYRLEERDLRRARDHATSRSDPPAKVS